MDEIVGILVEVTGADAGWAASITPDSAVEGDLGVESVELVALGDRLRERHGVDLPGFLAGLDIDRLVDLTVGDIVDHVVTVTGARR
jgi:acyl carrier protein